MIRRCAILSGLVAAMIFSAVYALAGDAPKGVKAGDPAPPFELTGCDGKTYKLGDFSDKIVVLEWVSKDCPFSRPPTGALPKMKELAAKYKDKNVVWLGIDSTHFHTAEMNVEYTKEHEINYPILSDFDGKVGRTYGAKTTPHMFVIHKGKVVYVGAPDEKDGERSYVSDALDALIAGKDVPVAETKSYGCSVKYKPVQ